MNDILIENWTIGFHLCEDRMWKLVFKKRTKKFWESGKGWPFTQVRVSGFSHHQKLVQAMRKKLQASNLIMFLRKIAQRFIYWILLMVHEP